MNNYTCAAEALADLRQRGYEADFNFDDAPYGLYCGDLDLRLDPQDYQVDEIYRFGVEAVPDGGSVVYAISCVSGVKGIIIEQQPV